MAKKQTIHTIKSLKAKTIDDAGCWIWQGYYANKSPNVSHAGQMVSVRRLFLDLLGKTYSPKAFMSASCEDHRCVNPEHIKIHTHAQHMARLLKQSHKSPTRKANVQKYKRQHEAKINIDIAREIRLSDETGPVLAQRYGINRSLISRIRRNEAWVDVNHPFLSLMR